jgi:hypothetical protein
MKKSSVIVVVLLVLVTMFMFRYDIEATSNSAYLLDRWTGDVYFVSVTGTRKIAR